MLEFSSRGIASLCLLVSCCLWSPTAGASDLKTVYSRAMKAYQSQQWEAAANDFRRLLPLMAALQQKHTKGSKAASLMLLGRCDVLYHLADIASKRKQDRASCRLHQEIALLRKQLPAGWRSWQVHPDVPRRLDESTQLLSGACNTVPAEVILQVTPTTATISLQLDNGEWNPIPGKTFPTRKETLSLQVQAEGYQIRVLRNVKVPRWRTLRLTIKLEKKPAPRPRIVARQPPRRAIRAIPPPPVASTPFYKTWWFWTITGVVVVGTTAAIVGGVVSSQNADQELVFRQNDPTKNGFPIFQ